MKKQRDDGIALRQGVVDREVVEALHDIAEVLSALIGEFSDVKEKVTLLEAMQKVLDVALANDERGGYGIYPAVGEEGVVEEAA